METSPSFSRRKGEEDPFGKCQKKGREERERRRAEKETKDESHLSTLSMQRRREKKEDLVTKRWSELEMGRVKRREERRSEIERFLSFLLSRVIAGTLPACLQEHPKLG